MEVSYNYYYKWRAEELAASVTALTEAVHALKASIKTLQIDKTALEANVQSLTHSMEKSSKETSKQISSLFAENEELRSKIKGEHEKHRSLFNRISSCEVSALEVKAQKAPRKEDVLEDCMSEIRTTMNIDWSWKISKVDSPTP